VTVGSKRYILTARSPWGPESWRARHRVRGWQGPESWLGSGCVEEAGQQAGDDMLTRKLVSRGRGRGGGRGQGAGMSG
jgi:hypothetical protein